MFYYTVSQCFTTLLEIGLPILTVLWAYVDLGLQINQSIIYYQHAAFNDNQTNQTWESKHSNSTDQFNLYSVSPTYFYVIVLVWIGTPLLRPLWICLYERTQNNSPYYSMNLLRIFYGPLVEPFMELFGILAYGPYRWLIDLCGCKCLGLANESLILGCLTGCILFFLYVIAALIYILVMIPAYYVYVPMLKVALILHKDPLWCIILACRVEAIPQLTLATVYFAKNYGHGLEHEDGIGLSVTAISCIFSLGSVVILLVTGFKAMR